MIKDVCSYHPLDCNTKCQFVSYISVIPWIISCPTWLWYKVSVSVIYHWCKVSVCVIYYWIQCIILCHKLLDYKVSVCLIHFCDIRCQFVSYLTVIQWLTLYHTLLGYKVSVCIIHYWDIRCQFVSYITGNCDIWHQTLIPTIKSFSGWLFISFNTVINEVSSYLW